jgi:hypothetical protein
VAHVSQDLPLVGCDAGGGKGAGVLCLRHEGADDGNAGAVGGDGVVGWGVDADVPEEVMAAGDTAGAGPGEVRGVGVAAQYHVRCAVILSAVGVGRGVAEEAVETGDGGGDGRGLFGSQWRGRRGHPLPDHSKADSQWLSAIHWPGRGWLGESCRGWWSIEAQRSHRREGCRWRGVKCV